MKIIFCGGGTVGHISPAIAIAEEILHRNKSSEILFIGRDYGEENEVIKKAGFILKTIKIHGLQRKLNINNIKYVFEALKAQKDAERIIEDFNPDIVFGTGGYVCWPVISAAKKINIPTVIHESNAFPGMATRLLANKCTRVLLGLPGSEKSFKRKDNLLVVGNPVKKEFTTANRLISRKKLGLTNKDFLISSFGGSGGSNVLNSATIDLMKNYVSKNRNIFHIHSCGKKYYAEIKSEYPELTLGKQGCTIRPYIDNMGDIMAASDVVISRCGAITLAEICSVGCCSILIPSPNVTNDHQRKNAELISESGAAIMINESDLTKSILSDTIKKLEHDAEIREKMKKEIRKFHIFDCKQKIVNELIEIIKAD